jgi:hypothetical protein
MDPSYVVRNSSARKFHIGIALEFLILLFGVGLTLGTFTGTYAEYLGVSHEVAQPLAMVVFHVSAAFTIVFAILYYRANIWGQLSLDTQQLSIPTLKGQRDIPLQEIESLQLRQDRSNTLISVRVASGRHYTLPEWFARSANWSEVLQSTIVPAIADRWAQVMRDGGEIKLLGGKLKLDRAGIGRGKVRFAWDEIESIAVDDSEAVIRTVRVGKPWRISRYVDNFLPLQLLISSTCDRRHQVSATPSSHPVGA